MVSADATIGGITVVHIVRGRQFSFPLKFLLMMNADFFHISAGIPPLSASLGEALSTVVRHTPRLLGLALEKNAHVRILKTWEESDNVR